MNLDNVLRAFEDRVWAITPEKLYEVLAVLELKASGVRLSDEEAAERAGPVARPAGGLVAGAGGQVAVLPVFGVLSQRVQGLARSSGATSTEELGAALDAAIRDPQVAAIVLNMDTPGGAVTGVPELAAQIKAGTQVKPIIAQVNSLAASGGYWLASQATEIAVTPSGDVGSIGVYRVHLDQSAAAEQAGVRATVISAGKYKVEGHPLLPLSEDARAAMQARVDEAYTQFVTAVAKGRGVPVDAVRNGFGEGRTVGAPQAVASGMADRVATLPETLARLTARGGIARAGAGRRADVTRVLYEYQD